MGEEELPPVPPGEENTVARSVLVAESISSPARRARESVALGFSYFVAGVEEPDAALAMLAKPR